jgi:hypothetical protein
LKEWIDQEMPLFYATTTTNGRFTDFPEPTRLGQNSTRSFKPKSSLSAYSAQICQQYGATDTTPTVQPDRQAWQRPPADIEYSLKDTTEFLALSSTKIDDTKSTALSTRLTVSEDFKSLIRKELAQFMEDAQTTCSELSQLKLDMSQIMQDIIRKELPSIVAEIQQQSTGIFLTTSVYKADMVAFQSNFQTSLEVQTYMIQQLSRQLQDMQDTTPNRKRPAPSTQEECDLQTLETGFSTQDAVDSDRFSSTSSRPSGMQE